MYNLTNGVAQIGAISARAAMPNMTNVTISHKVNLFWIHWDYSAVIIFRQWKTLDVVEDRNKFIIACAVVFFQAVIFMLLPVFRDKMCNFLAGCEDLSVQAAQNHPRNGNTSFQFGKKSKNNLKNDKSFGAGSTEKKVKFIKHPNRVRGFLLVYDFVQKIWSYLLMLISMTYNGYINTFLLTGLTMGYALWEIEVEYKQLKPQFLRKRLETERSEQNKQQRRKTLQDQLLMEQAISTPSGGQSHRNTHEMIDTSRRSTYDRNHSDDPPYPYSHDLGHNGFDKPENQDNFDQNGDANV